ncbi:MAG TPA: imelysin family protein, partial [Polyangiaceae bacterium]
MRPPTFGPAQPVSRRRLCVAAARALAGGLLASGLGAVACGPEPVPDRRRELLRSWTSDFLLAHYVEFGMKLKELRTASLALEDAPDEDALERAQSAWRAARRPWKETEVFNFGPVVDEPLRYGAKIDFWPARPAAVETVLAGPDALDPKALGAAAKGLPAVEYLLFAPGAGEAFRENHRRYEYLAVLIEDLITQSRALADAWDPLRGNYQSELVEAGRGSSTYDTLSMAL